MHKSHISRRALLRYAASLPLAGAAKPFALNLAALSAATAQTVADDDYKALVCVFLQGGNDHYNSVLATDPESWSSYLSLRTAGANISVAPVGEPGGALPINPRFSQAGRDFALHPELAPIAALFEQGNAAIIANTGPLVEPLTRTNYLNEQGRVPPKLFSHNDQTSVWQAFAPEGALYGWGGRMGDMLAAMNDQQSFTCISPAGNAVWISGNQTVPYQIGVSGPTAISGVSGGVSWPQGVTEILEQIITASSSNVFEQSLGQLTRGAIEAQQKLQTALIDSDSLPPVPQVALTGRSNWLATQLRIVARIIGGRRALGMKRQVFFVTLGGFDTHDNQIQNHAPLLQELSQAIEYFNDLMKSESVAASNKVTLMTASEFGRTLITNGDGTDHGWGSHHFIVGDAVRGGDIYGRFPDYSVDSQDDVGGGKLLPNLSVDQYGSTLARWFGVENGMLNDVFPNLANFGSERDVGFMLPG